MARLTPSRPAAAAAERAPLASDGLEEHRGVETLEREWDALAERTGASPFLRPAWVRAWWRAFGHGELWVLALREGDRLAAVLPMGRARGELHSPTNWHTPHFAPVTQDASAWQELARRLFARGERRIDVGFLLSGPDAAAATAAAERAGRLVHSRTLAQCPYVATAGDANVALDRLSKNRRKSLRRQLRRLEESGEVAFQIGGQLPPADVDALLAEAFRVEASGWKGRGGTAIVSDAATTQFYSAVSRWAAEQGWLRLSFLRLDGHAIAFDLSFEHAGTCYSLKAGYDASAATYGPGILLLHELVLWAYGCDVETLELLGGDEDYKRDWATGQRELVLVQGFSRSVAGRIEHSAVVHGRPAAKLARSAVRKVLR